MEGISRTYLAQILAGAGDLASAEREARAAAELLPGSPPARALAMATLAEVLLRTGRSEEALPWALDAQRVLDDAGSLEEGEIFVRLVHIEACASSGRAAAARAAETTALERLRARAAAIDDPALRRSYLERRPENDRLLARTGNPR